MKLTGKCKEDFLKWLQENYTETIITREGGDWGHGYSVELSVDDIIDELPESLQNALIIDFFDSVEIHMKIYPHMGGGQNVFYPSFCFRDNHPQGNEKNVLFDTKEQFYALTRLEAQNEVIKLANEFYNQKNR